MKGALTADAGFIKVRKGIPYSSTDSAHQANEGQQPKSTLDLPCLDNKYGAFLAVPCDTGTGSDLAVDDDQLPSIPLLMP